MSTRANIIVMDNDGNKMYFYRHSDGYPEGTKPTLNKFMKWLRDGKLRNNIWQSAGWLIIIGAAEYNVGRDLDNPETLRKTLHTPLSEYAPGGEDNFGMGWKVGAYEPATGVQMDVEYVYEINVEEKTLKTFRADKHPEVKAVRKAYDDSVARRVNERR